MVEQILLSSGSFDGVRETGGFGQPLHALYPQIRAVLAGELGPDAAGLLAEPVVDRAHNRIDWYTEGDPERKPVALSDLPEEQRQPILERIGDVFGRGREVAERYAASDDPRRAQLGAMLRVALGIPAETEVFLVEDRPVIIRWGFAPDRPWETLAGPVYRPAMPAPELAAPLRDVVVPDVAVPELATAAAPAPDPVVEPPSSLEPSPLPPESAFPPVNVDPLLPAPSHEGEGGAITDGSAKTLSPLVGEGWGGGSERLPPPKLEPDPAGRAAGSSPAPESAPVSPLRYVVVGSRYFWSVFALAVLLAVVAAFWWGMGRPSLSSGSGEKSGLSPDADLDRALTQAQRTEVELRTRLESLLVQLAERRGQCPLPAGSKPAAASPAVRGPERVGTIPALPTKPTGSGSERLAVPPPTVGVDTGGRMQSPPVTVPAGEADSRQAVETPATVTDREAPLASRPYNAGVEQKPLTPPPVAVTPPPVGSAPTTAVAPPPAAATSRPPIAGEPPARSLEEELGGRESMPVASSSRQPPVEPPVKADPTPEERREFASRMSAAGAATGEITATLLWNSPGDLDLVVRCPSGQQLDYRNPAACGGALDVDANAVRASLSDRPVENAFWPAGQAAPGSYEIAVRYAPRKDEQNPRETPFQVRLSRGGQEAVFKGTVRPNAVTPVTTFTVER